jgi:large subunit ribosomal protein L25
MEEILAQKREFVGKKLKSLRKKGFVPAILYGPEISPSIPLQVKKEELEEIVKKIGSSSMINLNFEGKKYSVLIHEIQRDPITDEIIHVDFFQPSLKEEIEAKVPLVFEGVAPAVKELGGTLVKNVSEIEVKCLPKNLPKEIKVDISKLKTFEDAIFVKDLKVPPKVKILRNPDDILAFVAKPEKIEEELAKPIEEKIEEIEVIKKEKPKETEEEEKEEE